MFSTCLARRLSTKPLRSIQRYLCIASAVNRSALPTNQTFSVNYTPQWSTTSQFLQYKSIENQQWSNSRSYNTDASHDIEVSCQELREDIANNENLYIIDVREPVELESGNKIPNSILIPLGEVESALKMTNKSFQTKYGHPKPPENGEDVVFYCAGGVRSLKATLLSRSLGYEEAKSLAGGMRAWRETDPKA